MKSRAGEAFDGVWEEGSELHEGFDSPLAVGTGEVEELELCKGKSTAVEGFPALLCISHCVVPWCAVPI